MANTIPSYVQVGNRVRVTGTFTNALDSYAAIDPGTVFVKVVHPDETVDSYQHGVDAEVVQSGVGIYYIDITIDTRGEWRFRWYSDVSAIASTEVALTVVGAISS